MDPRYQQRRVEMEKFFTPENEINEPPKIHQSPSGKYELTISRYHTKPKSWDYSRGIVNRLADNAAITDIKRNYAAFWHAWVNHRNGSEYLLCGEDYQGYSVINLGTGEHHIHFPERGYSGGGFCWAKVSPSPDGIVLAVEGCIWAGPYELVFQDFSNPEQLPLPELSRIEDVAECPGWKDNGTFVFQRGFDVRASDGALLEQLPEDEQERLYKIPKAIGYKTETGEWHREQPR